MEDERIKKIREFATEKYSEYYMNVHILPVVRNSLMLAKKLKINPEVVEVSSYLHDIGRAKNIVGRDEKDHESVGAKKAEEFLEKLGYKDKFIERVKICIFSHSSNSLFDSKDVEVEILRNADAMAHFDSFLDLFAYFYKKDNFNIKKTVEFVKDKINRDWNKKISIPEAREIAKPKYRAIILLINSMEENLK